MPSIDVKNDNEVNPFFSSRVSNFVEERVQGIDMLGRQKESLLLGKQEMEEPTPG